MCVCVCVSECIVWIDMAMQQWFIRSPWISFVQGVRSALRDTAAACGDGW